MAITAINQTEAHRRRLLIAGAAGLSDTETIMETHATVPAASDTPNDPSSASTYTGTMTGLPAVNVDTALD